MEHNVDSDSEHMERAHFGYKTVKATMQPALIQGIFRSVATRYDLMNDFMSVGIHRLWKDAFVDWLRPRAGMTFLDVAGGTGDIAFRILSRLPREQKRRVIICDLTQEMLIVGRHRAVGINQVSGVEWICGKAESLPFSDCSVDAYTIAFGLRNVTCIDSALKEAQRVLRPGGRFLCLEFSHVVLPHLRNLYDYYSFNIIPWLGEVITGDRDSYQYLVESIRLFPDQWTLCQKITAFGFSFVKYKNLSGGIAAMHSAWRI